LDFFCFFGAAVRNISSDRLMGRACALAEMNDYDIPAKHKDREILEDKIMLFTLIFMCFVRRLRVSNNNNNNNSNHDNVYDAVIMTRVIARVNSVHLMNVD